MTGPDCIRHPLEIFVMPYWQVTPTEDSASYDIAVFPAETEVDHRSALEYAQLRLEGAWDQAEPGSGQMVVTIEYCAGDMP